MEEKKQQIQQIAETMRQQGISLKDIASAIPTHLFDLRCNINGNQVRLPFEQGKNHKVVGIYPFPNIDFYIYTHESTEDMPTFAEKLIPIAIWKCLFQIKDELNRCLSELGLPVFEGLYFAQQDDLYNLIIDFSQKQIKNNDYQPICAKVRYCEEN